MATSQISHLPDKQTLTHLAQLLDAGIAPLEACIRLEKICDHDKRAIRVIHRDVLLKRGLASGIYRAGFCSRVEHQFIRIAETSGKLGVALRFVSNNLVKRQQRAKQLRARLLLPIGALLIMLFINIIVSMTTKVPLSTILFNITLVIIVIITSSQLLLIAARQDASRWLSLGWTLRLHDNSKLFQRYFENLFFTLFCWQIEAGIDYISGSEALKSLLSAKSYAKTIDKYQKLISAGNGIAFSLIQTHLIKTAELKKVAVTGEESGRFSQALTHYLISEGHRLDSTSDTIFTWLPRIYYLFMIIYAVRFFL
jgi:type II secretory pathway component PulF